MVIKTWRSQTSSLGTLVLGLFLTCICSGQDSSTFKETFSYADNNRLGKRLSVSFPNAPTDAGKSTELTLFNESFYDVGIGGYSERKVAIITGMGLGTSGT
jgi:hypothetical protein